MSDDAHDAVVELFFHTVPSMDGKELGDLLNAVLRIMEREVRAALREERERQWKRLRPSNS